MGVGRDEEIEEYKPQASSLDKGIGTGKTGILGRNLWSKDYNDQSYLYLENLSSLR